MAAVYGILVGLFIYKELKFKDFPKIIFQAVIGTTIIMFLVGAANVFGWLLTNLQIPHHVGAFVASLTSSPVLFLLAMNVLLAVHRDHGQRLGRRGHPDPPSSSRWPRASASIRSSSACSWSATWP